MEEVIARINEEAKKIGIDKHPGFKDAINDCTAAVLDLEGATVEVDNDKLIIKNEQHHDFFHATKNIAIISKSNSDIILEIIQKIKEPKVIQDKDGRQVGAGEVEYISTKQTRKIDENGIETKRIFEWNNNDYVQLEKITYERRGLREVYYTKENHNKIIESGIGGIAIIPEHGAFLQKLDFNYTELPNEPVVYEAVDDKELSKCFKNLNEKQREGLLNCPNGSFSAYRITGENIENEIKHTR